MMIEVMHWERRDTADRADLGKSAFALTQALRADGAASSRFYWVDSDTVVIQSHVGDTLTSSPPSSDAARALFTLGDLARPARRELWLDPGAGEEAYRQAGR